ncbi:hypothetical protein KKF81_00400 [Candidatus Micrarchaeota archaeon]|nr:hypothetical protein [Candidatus Micrarchaeota archaeon]MBU1165378.1 hypothetical protein [Candidatus Micrarchaeota archaeon]MBU1886223.1 hypothetical protein [Candidatus Micrarchaeota archaeon]
MKLIAIIIGLFIVAQLLGMYTGLVILSDMHENDYVKEMVMTNNGDEPINAVFLIVYILFGAVMMMLLIRVFKKYSILFRLMEFMMIATASSIVFYSVLRLGLGYDESTIGGIVLGLLFSGIRTFVPNLKNTAAVLATAGVGVIVGISFGLVPLVIFLILLSIYDYISVFKTKHMVELANFVVKKDLAFTITAKLPAEKKGEPENRMDLGTGDMIAPIMLEISALSFNPIASVFVFVGAVVSMTLFLLLVWKKKMVLPALPPIVLGMIIALMIGFVVGAY